MAENRSTVLSEAELRALREILFRARATDVESLQRQVKSIGVGLADLLVKAVVALEGGLQDTRGHLRVAVETMVEQAEELEQIKGKMAGSSSFPPSFWPFASAPGTAPGAGSTEAAPAAGRLDEVAERLDALARDLAVVREGVSLLGERVDALEFEERPAREEGVLERLGEHVYLLSLAQARRAAEARVARGAALARVAEEVEQLFLPQVVMFRRELGADVVAYDGFRGLEDRARETCEDLRRESRRVVQAASAGAARLDEVPGGLSERLDSVRDLLALGGVASGEDDLDFEVRRAVGQWLMPLIDLTMEYRETTGEAAQAAFHSLLADLAAAGRHVGLDLIAPVRGAAFDPALHETEDAAPGGPARITRVEAPGYRIGGAVLRRARVRLVE